MPKLVKQFGERNTATNAVRSLVSTIPNIQLLPSTAPEIDPVAYQRLRAHCWNCPKDREAGIDAIFAVAGERCAWKHCATVFADASSFADCLVLFSVRHPASWLVGLFDNPYHALSPVPSTMREFVQSEWKTVGRERLGSRSFRPLELLNAKLRSYRDFAAALAEAGIAFRFIRFEDVVLQQETIFRAIAADLGEPDARFEPLQQSTKDPARSLADYQRHYGQEAWRAALAGVEDCVNRQVDWSLVSDFGYAPI